MSMTVTLIFVAFGILHPRGSSRKSFLVRMYPYFALMCSWHRLFVSNINAPVHPLSSGIGEIPHEPIKYRRFPSTEFLLSHRMPHAVHVRKLRLTAGITTVAFCLDRFILCSFNCSIHLIENIVLAVCVMPAHVRQHWQRIFASYPVIVL